MGKTSRKEPSLVYFQAVLDFRGRTSTPADENGHFLLRVLIPFLVLAFEDMPENFHSPELAKKCEGKGEKVELEDGARKSSVVFRSEFPAFV